MSSVVDWRREWGLLLIAALLALPLFTPRLYGADEVKYVTHLRSVYFDGDLTYNNDYQLFIDADPQTYDWLHSLADNPTSTGRFLNDAPIGAPLLWLPFYVVGDLVVVLARAAGSGVARNGVSQPYVWAITLGSLFWGLFGLALIYRTCRLYFDRRSSQLSVLALWFASAMVFYLYITPPMAHANSVFAVALFTWLWLRGREAPRSLGAWTALGASAGLMVLVRELNWLMMIPLLFDEGMKLIAALRGRDLRGWSVRVPGYLTYGTALAVIVLPQFLVYQALHGSLSPTPFVTDKFSYPQFVLPVLFSGFHGLYSWTPVTLLATLGLGFLGRRRPVVAAGFGLAFLAQLLVVGSYATWWGGASFGARRFLNCTPLFAVGLAALFAAVPRRRRRLTVVGVGLLVVWNFGVALQYATGLIPRDAHVPMQTLVVNQFTEVPRRTVGVAWRFLTDRWSMVENAPRDAS
jgi:hypothetical protein